MLEVDHGECPLCRAEFDDMLPVPRIEDDSDAWFDVCDADGDGSLSAREVYEILIAQFPVDHKKLEENLPRLFRTWDPNMDGQIEKHEFLRPEGLLEYVKQNFIRMEERAPPPNICRDKRAWFEYFDDDKSGELSQEEVGRALIKSFGLENKLSEIASMKETVACCWAIFDPDGSGEIDMDEFLNNDGIADAIIAATQHTPPPTEEVLAAAIAAAENSRPHPNLPEESW
jgi:Ca2+-binding EF-hand superfamily protein